MQVNTNVYNYLSTTLVPKKRNTTHKSSELKEVYTSMARYNKNSPLFLLSMSDTKQSHMINIKEAALTLKDVADSFANPESSIYQKKMLHSNDEDSVSGGFRPNANQESLPDELSIDIHSLATEQVNIGEYLDSRNHEIRPGKYSFVMNTLSDSVPFNVNVSGDENTMDVQQKVASLINNRNLGVTASVLTDGASSALMLSSNMTGNPGTPDGLHFSFGKSGESRDLISELGLNNVSTYPTNSEFSINGGTHSSSSNHISINQMIELDFHKPTDKPVTISFVPDSENAFEQINAFVDAYNGLVDLASKEGKNNVGSRNLFNDISSIVKKHQSELSSAGLVIGADNRLQKDETLLAESVQSGEFADLFKDLSSFRTDIDKTTTRLTLDPMAYVNKLLVTYPNTKNKYNNTYTQSLYSGLMYNNYA